MRDATPLKRFVRRLVVLILALPSLATSDQLPTSPHAGILVPPIESVFKGPLRDSLRVLSDEPIR